MSLWGNLVMKNMAVLTFDANPFFIVKLELIFMTVKNVKKKKLASLLTAKSWWTFFVIKCWCRWFLQTYYSTYISRLRPELPAHSTNACYSCPPFSLHQGPPLQTDYHQSRVVRQSCLCKTDCSVKVLHNLISLSFFISPVSFPPSIPTIGLAKSCWVP